MRLLNVHTLGFHEFPGVRIPRYAILSHTWGEEEVTLQDMKEGRAESLKGYRKITGCCDQARYDGLPYVWIDTCCIDKQSSAELSEAINSMYRWYESATVCYAYLEDVEETQHEGMESFRRSRYWTRGWTLQELIAPRVMIFFSSRWERIDSRLDVRQVIAEVTKIPKQVLKFRNISDFSVSQKMSWASQRRTTRIEDEAYCLLGLFGVSMPLLYGEGRKAFHRLQEEIIKELDDESIFAWQGGTDHGLLASCPAQFTFSRSIQRSIEPSTGESEGGLPFTITNRGIRISLPVIEDWYAVPLFSLTRETSKQYLVPDPHPHLQKRVLAVLNCQQGADATTRMAVVFNQDISRKLYIRDVNIGVVRISLTDVVERSTMKQLIVAASGKDPWDDAPSMFEDPGRLVVIQGLSGIAADCKFGHASLLSGIAVDHDLQENGTVSIRFRQSRTIAVIYRGGPWPEYQYLVIYLSIVDSRTVAAVTIAQKEHDNAWQFFIPDQSVMKTMYENTTGAYTVSLTTREAEHASIVEVKVGRQHHAELSHKLDR